MVKFCDLISIRDVFAMGDPVVEVTLQYRLMILNHRKGIFDAREINLIVTIKQGGTLNGEYISAVYIFYTSKHAYIHTHTRPIDKRDRSFAESPRENK